MSDGGDKTRVSKAEEPDRAAARDKTVVQFGGGAKQAAWPSEEEASRPDTSGSPVSQPEPSESEALWPAPENLDDVESATPSDISIETDLPSPATDEQAPDSDEPDLVTDEPQEDFAGWPEVADTGASNEPATPAEQVIAEAAPENRLPLDASDREVLNEDAVADEDAAAEEPLQTAPEPSQMTRSRSRSPRHASRSRFNSNLPHCCQR